MYVYGRVGAIYSDRAARAAATTASGCVAYPQSFRASARTWKIKRKFSAAFERTQEGALVPERLSESSWVGVPYSPYAQCGTTYAQMNSHSVQRTHTRERQGYVLALQRRMQSSRNEHTASACLGQQLHDIQPLRRL